MKINGAWKDGYVLDYHIKHSEFLGYDGAGHPQFHTERTPIGELVYRLKYKGDEAALDELVPIAADFIRTWNIDIEAIVPVPASTARAKQPVVQISQRLADTLGVPLQEVVIKGKTAKPIKDVFDYAERLKLLEGAHSISSAAVSGRPILLVDDLYRSGATLNAVTTVLSSQGKAREVYTFCPTRTKKS